MSKIPNLLGYSQLASRNRRLYIPKDVLTKLSAQEGDIIGFFDEDGKVVLKKMKMSVDE